MRAGVRVVRDFAPPIAAEVEAIRAGLGSGEIAGIGIRSGMREHGIPVELRRRWLGELFPDTSIGEVVEGEATSSADHAAGAELPGIDAGDAAQVRSNPLKHWDQLPEVVRPDYLVRVAIVGPESVGKSTLAANLAERTGGRDVQEFARDAFPWSDPGYRALPEHMVEICRGHRRWIEEAERGAERYLFSDTEALSTLAWSELYFGSVPPEVHDFVDRQDFDLFLLLDADVPWVADGTRTWEDHREPLHRRLRELLDERGLRYREISGSWTDRLDQALTILAELGPPRRPRGVPGRYP